jgi:hypothetical protein
MKLRLRFQQPLRIGLALAADRMTAVRLGRRGSVTHVHVRTLAAGPGGWLDLSEALSELKTVFGGQMATVSVALLPPLVQVKRLELPPLGQDELERVLTRDAVRYFLDGGGRKVIGACRLRSEGTARRGVLAAAADADLIEQVYREIGRLDWTVSGLVPAHSAWATHAGQRWDSPRKTGWVAILGVASVELIHAGGSAVLFIRRLPATGSADEIAAELAAVIRQSSPDPGQPLMVLGESALRRGFQNALQTHGVVTLPAEDSPDPEADPHTVAAACAQFGGVELIPEPVAREQRRRAGVFTRNALVASFGFLLAAAGLERLGLERELHQITARRAELSGRVTQAMTVRDATENLAGWLEVIDQAQRSARPWSAILGTVAQALPKDAHLVAWHASVDSLRMEGQAQRATAVFESLQQAPGIGGVRAEAPIQQEVRDTGPPIERFLLGARLTSVPAGETQ